MNILTYLVSQYIVSVMFGGRVGCSGLRCGCSTFIEGRGCIFSNGCFCILLVYHQSKFFFKNTTHTTTHILERENTYINQWLDKTQRKDKHENIKITRIL